MHYSYNVTTEELFDLFGRFGPVRLVYTSFVSRWVYEGP